MTPPTALHPVASQRVFLPTPTTKLSDLEGATFDTVVDAFEKRIRQWYVDPGHLLAKHHNFAFGVAAIGCLLVDTLSQYDEGIAGSSDAAFKRFARARLPGFKKTISPLIHLPGGAKIRDFADALWDGFRCAILHEARLATYCVIDPNHSPMIEALPGTRATTTGRTA